MRIQEEPGTALAVRGQRASLMVVPAAVVASAPESMVAVQPHKNSGLKTAGILLVLGGAAFAGLIVTKVVDLDQLLGANASMANARQEAPNRTPAPPPSDDPPTPISLEELKSAAATNQVEARSRYGKRPLQFEATLLSVAAPPNGASRMVFVDSPPVTCDMKPGQEEAVSQLRQGMVVMVTGRFKGMGRHGLHFDECTYLSAH